MNVIPLHVTSLPEHDTIHLWQASLDIEPLYRQTLTGLLSADEKARANGFHFDADRRRFIAARGTLRFLLGAYLERSPASLEFTYGAYGKPSLKGLPKTAPLFFNLSHAADLAVYAITRTAPVGIDVERIRSDIDVEEIPAAVFTREEAASLAKLPGSNRYARFYQIWTRKEAYCKARGHGLSQDLQEIDASLPEETSLHWFTMRASGVPVSDVRVHDLNIGAAFAAAIAIESDVTPVIVYQDSKMIPPRTYDADGTGGPPSQTEASRAARSLVSCSSVCAPDSVKQK